MRSVPVPEAEAEAEVVVVVVVDMEGGVPDPLVVAAVDLASIST
jgi:hypothetical protein